MKLVALQELSILHVTQELVKHRAPELTLLKLIVKLFVLLVAEVLVQVVMIMVQAIAKIHIMMYVTIHKSLVDHAQQELTSVLEETPF